MLKTITSKQLKKLMDSITDVTVVNVLGRAAFEQGHIHGSINIPVDEIETEALKLLDRDETIVVHCTNDACSASETAGEKLQKMGFKDVRRFKGGIEEWKQSGFSLEGQAYRKAA
ncbi:MAG: rhodanese-like domain-containing protein [Deltaproteobacteria bacterium]|nr:rhodanese-like domain-containing protein [Deltaproteobacteria bacterium]